MLHENGDGFSGHGQLSARQEAAATARGSGRLANPFQAGLTMKIKSVGINFVVVVLSTALALLLCEWGARQFLWPADYLQVEIVTDPVLGAVPSESTRAHGFDSWGFRNPAVPETADIVAIGDSHTYGNTATMNDSWPSVL